MLSCAMRFVDTPPSRPNPGPDMSIDFQRLVTAPALLLAGVARAASQARRAEHPRRCLLDGVAAVVNDGIVLRSDTRPAGASSSRDRLEQQGQQLPPRNLLRQQVLERLVMQEIQMQRAARLGIKVSDEMVNQALTDVAARNNIKFSDLPAALEAQGVDYRGYREDVRREMTLNTAAPARRLLAHLRLAARDRPVRGASARARPATTTNTTSRTSWSPSRPPPRPSRPRNASSRAQGIYERARSAARTSPSSRSPTRTPARRSRAARSAGARANQLPSFAAEAIPR